MTLGELLELDRVRDLSHYLLAAQAKELAFLYDIDKDLWTLGQGVQDGRFIWKIIIRSIRTLLKEPSRSSHQTGGLPFITAIHAVGVFPWAPPVARQIAPLKQPRPRVIVKSLFPKAAINHPGVLRVIEFWAQDLQPGGAEESFLAPGEIEIQPVPGFPGLVCGKCGRLNPRTPAGYLPKRKVCEQCQKAKEHAAWKARDPERAKMLWRNATNARRRRLRGEDA